MGLLVVAVVVVLLFLVFRKIIVLHSNSLHQLNNFVIYNDFLVLVASELEMCNTYVTCYVVDIHVTKVLSLLERLSQAICIETKRPWTKCASA